MRFAMEAKTASTVLTWGTTDVLVGADQIRGVYIGTVAQTAKLGRSCASGARYDPSAIRSWLPSADSLLRAAGPDSADSRPSIQTLFLPNRAGGGVMLGRLRKGARQWDPSPILYFMDAQGRGQLTEQGNLHLALSFLVALGRAGAASVVVEDGRDPRATFCDQYVQDSAAAAGVQPVELKG